MIFRLLKFFYARRVPRLCLVICRPKRHGPRSGISSYVPEKPCKSQVGQNVTWRLNRKLNMSQLSLARRLHGCFHARSLVTPRPRADGALMANNFTTRYCISIHVAIDLVL